MDTTNRSPSKPPFRVLRALTVLFALLVIAVIVIELMSWNFLKGPITERVEAMTGRDMEITGDIDVGLLPRPHLELGEMKLANADWAKTPEMLSVGGVELEPSIISLFKGEPALKSVTITEPTLNLESREGKPGNWALPAMKDRGENAGEEESSGPSLAVQQLNIHNAEIRYFTPETERPQVLSLTSLTLAGDRLSLNGEARLWSEGERLVMPVELSAAADPGLADSQWALSDIQARAGEVRIDGNISVGAGSSPVSVDGNLHSPSINVTDILAALPESQATDEPPSVSIPVLPDLQGDIHLAVDQLILEPTTFTNVGARLRPGQHELALETLSFDVAGGRGEARAHLVSNADFITAKAELELQQVALDGLGADEESTTILDAELELGLRQMQQAASLDPRTILEHLDIELARASYRTKNQATEAGSDLALHLEQVGEPQTPVLSITGRFQGKPLEMTIEGAPLPELAKGAASYRLQAQAQSGDLLAWADTQLGALLTPASFAGNLVLQGDGGQDLGAWIGAPLPALPGYRLSGRLARDGERWSVTSLDGNVGVSNLSGEFHFHTTDRPTVNVDLEADRIELAQFTAENSQPDPSSNDDAEPGDAGSPLAALRAIDGQLNLQVDTLVLPDTPELTNLNLSASLDSGRLQIEPLDFNIAGGSWGSSVALDATDQPASGTIETEFESIALSRFGDTFTPLEDRLGTLSGHLHLGITESLAVDQTEDLIMPFIGRLVFEPSQLTFTESEADTDFTLNLQTQGLEAGEQAFHIDGDGEYDGSPFSLRFRGDQLLAARDPDRPYALELTSDVVDSRIQVQGSILRPLALKGLDLELGVQGPNPGRLSRLLGIPLPDLPPYSLSGDLSFRDNRWAFSNIEGDVGDSDLGGQIALDISSRPPHLTGKLHSDSLDLADLGVLAGVEPESAEQDGPESSNGGDGDRFALPDQPLITAAWEEVSADVSYRGKAVRAADIPLSEVVIDFNLADGHARFEPVGFGVGEGQVDFNLDIDSRPTPPEGTLQLEVQAVNLSKAIGSWELASDSVGTVAGQGKFWMTGASIAELFGSADGGMVMLMTRGKLDALLVELAGLDAAESFVTWMGGGGTVPIDCAYVDLKTQDGVVRIDTLAVDTTDTSFTGTGTANFDNERLDITLFSHPKDASALAAGTPLHLGGTFNNPEPGLKTGDLAMQIASSAILAAVATPVAALLPLLDLGTGNEVAYCEGLASRSLDAIDDNPGGKDESDNNEG
ncbi:AsmA family protein [Marinobacter panjinensis]|uniref:AsmA family protein n=1 Tax=Marinobacter panjinensis TaxID=2576384 RepID=A0A4U6R000_9GAMM|nr:AsmA family protein [Marinobacter panjinensis]MCR8915497.1 AsmA family protein [Marinobacter panjinensis]TKV66750.1 AsmA family protein [Marinobacter panjinensis]